jgi:hypothetical protein
MTHQLLPPWAAYQFGPTPYTSVCLTSAMGTVEIAHPGSYPVVQVNTESINLHNLLSIITIYYRSHPVWEIVMNELDRRDDPTFDESLPGCHMVDSCSNIQTGEQFARLLRHNFNRHLNTNRAPLGLHFHASWLKSKREFKEELIKFIEEMLQRTDTYFVTMVQVTRFIFTIWQQFSVY